MCVCFKSSDVKYMTYHHIDELYQLFANQEKEKEEQGGQLEEDDVDPHASKCLMRDERDERERGVSEGERKECLCVSVSAPS